MEQYAKSSEVSSQMREIGNQFYVKRNFFDAIVKYNESLCYAESESENAGLAYANRSAVYFEMKIYDKSLNNIELARSHNYPEKNLHILMKREEKCKEMMKKQSTQSSLLSENFFKLSHEAYANFKNIAKCLELKCDKKYGRYIITNKDLNVGDIVAIEKSFCHFVQENFIHQQCTHCLKSNALDLIPCKFCSRGSFNAIHIIEI
jgi:uncharacterized FlaG/YvyC family protein